MKLIRTLLTLLLFTLLLSSMAFAGGKGDKQEAVTGEGKVLDVLWHSCPAGRETSKLHPEFEEKYGVKVNYHEISHTIINQKIMLEWAAKTGAYDVVNTWNIDGMYGSGAGMNLNPFIEKDDAKYVAIDDILPTMKELMTRDGKWIAFPVRNDTRLMYLNRRMFKNAGMDADNAPPVTFEETLAAAKKLHNQDKDEAGWIIGYKGNYPYGWVVPYWTRTFGGEVYDSKWKPIFNSAEGKRAMQFYINLFRKHKVTLPDALNVNHTEQTTALLTARGAININVPGRWADQFKPAFPKVKDDLTVAAPPREKAYRPPSGGWGLVVLADTDMPEIAYKYAVWASTSELQKRIIKKGGDCNPTRTSVIADTSMQKDYPIFKALYDIGSAAEPSPKFAESNQAGDIINKYLRKAASGEITVDQALDTAAEKVELLLMAVGKYD